MQNFIVYKSSAGSGKTFTLVKEYLTLALANESQIKHQYRRILALTFTNKAAAEMRIRIINALTDIAENRKNNALENELLKALKIDADTLNKRANVLIEQLLHHYSDFAVSTIDSFSHKIVKTFAHDLKLPVNFNLQTDTTEFYEKVITRLFSEVGENIEITKLLKNYVLNNLNEESNWDPEQDIQKFADLIQKESSREHIHNLSELSEEELEAFKTQIHSYIQSFRNDVIQLATQAVELMRGSGLNDDGFTQKSRGPQTFFYKCLELNLQSSNINSYVQAAMEGKWAGKDLDNHKNDVFSRVGPKLTELAQKLVNLHHEKLTEYNFYLLIHKKLFLLQLLRKIQKIAEELKQDEQLVFIEEFNSKIYEFIKNEPVSYIYERLGERYKHFLIDEFQDTSTLQWQNILPLVDNSLASGNFNLLVGDGKQSIYRWRNANVKQFAILPKIDNPTAAEHLIEREKALIRNYKEEILNTNYRSFETVIQFNNSLFNYLRDTFLASPFNNIYNQQEQKAFNLTTGFVTIQNKKLKREELLPFHEQQTLNRIRQSTQNGFHYSDICILSRNNKQGSQIASFLSKQNIPVISSDSLLLQNCKEVNVLSAFFNYLQNHHNQISASVVLNYYRQIGKINNNTLHELLHLSKKIKLTETLKHLNINISETELNSKNLLDTAIYLIENLQLNHTQNASVYLRFYLDEIGRYMSSHNSNINDFNEWWNKRCEKASLIISENINAVKIMTIHASKGLEFPVVIIPFCNWSFRNEEKWVQVNEKNLPVKSAYLPMDKKAEEAGLGEYVKAEKQEILLDNINLLYVAFTRAAEELHVISSTNESNKKEGIWQHLDSYLANQTILKQTDEGYEMGTPVLKTHETKQAVQPIVLEQLKFEEHLHAVKIKGGFLKNTEQENEARNKGVLMHYILSKIHVPEQLPKAISDAVSEGALNEMEAHSISATLESLMLLPELKPYFSKDFTYKTERELLSSEGEILRPDRIAISENELCIIDYKTGKEDLKKHQAQMLKYEKCLAEMNHKKIKKLLVYIENLKVIQLS
jgi:ATP-dependent exoDNAse (exonuclease V) beta subunit